jgi:hypothetical protein
VLLLLVLEVVKEVEAVECSVAALGLAHVGVCLCLPPPRRQVQVGTGTRTQNLRWKVVRRSPRRDAQPPSIVDWDQDAQSHVCV